MDLVKQYSQSEYTAIFQSLCGLFPLGSPVVTDRLNGSFRVQNGHHHPVMSESCQSAYVSSEKRRCPIRKNGVIQKTEAPTHKRSHSRQNSKDLRYYVKYKTLYYLFKVASFFGDELFYLMFYPFCIWNLDSVVTRKAMVIWCMAMYSGQAAKDLIRWPRPSSPPVVRLENTYQQEFGMPSTHAMAATAIPFSLLYIVMQKYEVSLLLTCTIAVTWCVLVCLSRLYLGVHSVSDVVVGILYAIGIIVVSLPCLDRFDFYQQTNPFAPFVMFVIGLAVCTICYPNTKDGFKTSKGDAVQIISVIVGISCGVWLNYQLGITYIAEHSGLFQIQSFTWQWLVLSILRFLVGGLMVAITRAVTKPVTIRFTSYILGLEIPCKDHPSVNTTYKFCTYFAIGLVVVCGSPAMFSVLGIQRPAYYSEVL